MKRSLLVILLVSTSAHSEMFLTPRQVYEGATVLDYLAVGVTCFGGVTASAATFRGLSSDSLSYNMLVALPVSLGAGLVTAGVPAARMLWQSVRARHINGMCSDYRGIQHERDYFSGQVKKASLVLDDESNTAIDYIRKQRALGRGLGVVLEQENLSDYLKFLAAKKKSQSATASLELELEEAKNRLMGVPLVELPGHE